MQKSLGVLALITLTLSAEATAQEPASVLQAPGLRNYAQQVLRQNGGLNGFRFGGRESFATALLGISIPLWAGRKQWPVAEAALLADYGAARARLAAALGEEWYQ